MSEKPDPAFRPYRPPRHSDMSPGGHIELPPPRLEPPLSDQYVSILTRQSAAKERDHATVNRPGRRLNLAHVGAGAMTVAILLVPLVLWYLNYIGAR